MPSKRGKGEGGLGNGDMYSLIAAVNAVRESVEGLRQDMKGASAQRMDGGLPRSDGGSSGGVGGSKMSSPFGFTGINPMAKRATDFALMSAARMTDPFASRTQTGFGLVEDAAGAMFGSIGRSLVDLNYNLSGLSMTRQVEKDARSSFRAYVAANKDKGRELSMDELRETALDEIKYFKGRNTYMAKASAVFDDAMKEEMRGGTVAEQNMEKILRVGERIETLLRAGKVFLDVQDSQILKAGEGWLYESR